MKKMITRDGLVALTAVGLTLLSQPATVTAQSATISLPIGIGRKCDNSGADSVKTYSYNANTDVLSFVAKCKPVLAAPGFSSSGASVAFNPKDQLLYYIRTTNGNNSIVWRWSPTSCPAVAVAQYKNYSNAFVVGVDFDPATGLGYQVEFTGSSAPYSIYLRQVDFATNTFGTPYPITLGTNTYSGQPSRIYSQNGDLVITPQGVMYFVFDNKLFNCNFKDIGSLTLNGTFIDSLQFPATHSLVGLAYAEGKLVGSISNNAGTCYYREMSTTSGGGMSSISTPGSTFASYDLASVISGVGASKKVFSVAPTGGGNYRVYYDVRVRNYGNTTLNNVQVSDDLASVFGASLGAVSLAVVGSLPSGLTLNGSYDGNANKNLFASNGTLNTSPAEEATIRISVDLNAPNINTTYYINALATATNPFYGSALLDSSNNSSSLDIDPNANGKPDDIGEAVPTPLSISSWLVLPNHISELNAQSDQDTVNLSWSIVQQQNLQYLELQRSIDGTYFSTIQTLNVNGNATGTVHYHQKDVHPEAGLNYYRIGIVSKDGSERFSNIVRLTVGANPRISVQIGPNPFSAEFDLLIKVDRPSLVQYRLLDYASRTILNRQVDVQAGENKIHVDGLAQIIPGTYVLEISSASDRFVQRVVKE